MSLTRRLASRLSRAAKFATVAALGWLIIGWWVWSCYDARGEWYANYGSSRPILTGIYISAVGVFFFFAERLKPGRQRRRIACIVPAVVVLGCCLQIAFHWFYPAPSLEAARASADVGDDARAEAELRAVETRGDSSAAALALRNELDGRASIELEKLERENAKVADDQRLGQVSNASLKVGTTLVLQRRWSDSSKQETARRRLLERAQVFSDGAWEQGDGAALGRIVDDTRGLDAAFTAQSEARALLATGQLCAEEKRWDCVDQMLARLDEGAVIDPRLESVRKELQDARDASAVEVRPRPSSEPDQK
jgi:hypothetical protein